MKSLLPYKLIFRLSALTLCTLSLSSCSTIGNVLESLIMLPFKVIDSVI